MSGHGRWKELIVKYPLPTRKLPERPDLAQLKRQAKELLDAFLAGDRERADDATEVRAILKVRPELVDMVEAWNYEYTPLHYAVLERNAPMVRLLMESGADPHAGISPHNEATAAITIADERGYHEIAAIIREEESRRESGRPTADLPTPELRAAMRAGDEDRAIAILEHHRDLVRVHFPDPLTSPAFK